MADYEERLLRVLDKEKIPLALDLLSEAAIKDTLKTVMCDVLFDRSGLKAEAPFCGKCWMCWNMTDI